MLEGVEDELYVSILSDLVLQLATHDDSLAEFTQVKLRLPPRSTATANSEETSEEDDPED